MFTPKELCLQMTLRICQSNLPNHVPLKDIAPLVFQARVFFALTNVNTFFILVFALALWGAMHSAKFKRSSGLKTFFSSNFEVKKYLGLWDLGFFGTIAWPLEQL